MRKFVAAFVAFLAGFLACHFTGGSTPAGHATAPEEIVVNFPTANPRADLPEYESRNFYRLNVLPDGLDGGREVWYVKFVRDGNVTRTIRCSLAAKSADAP